MLQAAEREYSNSRFQSIQDEWDSNYPGILFFLNLLKNRDSSFLLSGITEDEWKDKALKFVCEIERPGKLFDLSREIVENDSYHESRSHLVWILYNIGAIGLKTDSNLPVHWSHERHDALSPLEITDFCRVTVHPALHRTLGINIQKR